MKRSSIILIAALLCATATAPRSESSQGQPQTSKFLRVESPVPNQYIVTLKDDLTASDVAAAADNLSRQFGGTKGFVYESANQGLLRKATGARGPRPQPTPDGRVR